jgi:hypothetical protein
MAAPTTAPAMVPTGPPCWSVISKPYAVPGKLA